MQFYTKFVKVLTDLYYYQENGLSRLKQTEERLQVGNYQGFSLQDRTKKCLPKI